MLVNPQFFNYKLIIGSLLMSLVMLSSVALISLKSLKSHQQFLANEKKLVENELSQVMTNFIALKKDTQVISSQLHQTKFQLDSLKAINSKIYKVQYTNQ